MMKIHWFVVLVPVVPVVVACWMMYSCGSSSFFEVHGDLCCGGGDGDGALTVVDPGWMW